MRKILLCILLCSLHDSICAQPGDRDLLQDADSLILNSKFEEVLRSLRSASGGPSIPIINKQAEVLTRLGNFREAEVLLIEAQKQLNLHPNDFMQGTTEANLGFLQLNQGRSDLAEESLKGALRRFESSGKTSSQEFAKALSGLGLVYISQGKYSQAQDQLHRALAVRQNLSANKKGFLAATFNDLGLAYSQTDKDMALDFYEQAHKMYLELYGNLDPKIAISNINIGIIYRDLELFGDAVSNFETALKIWNDVYSKPHPAKAIALYNLGQTYLQLNDRKAAKEYYQQALKMYEDSYGSVHPEVASVLNAVGNLQVAESDFDEALKIYQNALRANVFNFRSDDPKANPPLRDYYNGTRFLHTLLFKAQAFEAKYSNKSLKFADLQEALRLLVLCDSLIDQLRQHSTNENDKMMLGVIADEVYADGVRVAYLAGLNAVRKDIYFEKAFYFAEKSKSAVLLESISDANAKSFAGIPSELLEQEKALKSGLALTAQKLAEKPAPEQEKLLRETSFDLKRQYEVFIKKLEGEFPEYFNLKFNSATPSIPEVQSLLKENTALISYFLDEKNRQLYIFLVRKQQFRIWQRAIPADFNKFITGLRNGLYFQEINTFKKSAYYLGDLLLPPLPSSVEDLVILPAGKLSLIPFETLLTDNADKVVTYNEMSYLLNKYSIRYEFSAGLLLQKSHAPVQVRNSIFLCAPVTFPQKSYLGELPGTEKEVREISNLFKERDFKSESYTRREANEQLVKTGSIKNFGFVHFATHGVVDEANPELSRIFLQGDASQDGDLFAGEIYNLQLNANLVTLSACQTGLGKVLKGEGVIGLSRALVYAGARSMVVSYWNVADESTAIIMASFYRHILENPLTSYGQALRAAKLDLQKSGKFNAPYFWAPFVLIGF